MAADPSQFAELHQRLLDQLAALTTGDDWLQWLESARFFHRYSPQNQMLLQIQGAEGHVASYRTWQRLPAVDGSRCQVRKGERGMTILAPLTVTRREIDEVTGDEIVAGVALRGFKQVKVFHQGQLVSPPAIPEQPLPELLTGDNRFQHVWAALTSHLIDLGYDVELHTRTPSETWNGRTDFTAAQVLVADDLERPQQLKTLIHEWAHIALDHADMLATVDRDVLEVEAESVAFLVSSTIGLDSSAYSVPYLASWSNGNIELVERTVQRVLATTASLVNTLEVELSIDVTPDLLTAAHPTPVVDLVEPSPAPPPIAEIGPVVIATIDTGTDSTVERAPAGLRRYITNLDPDDRELLLDSLNHLDRDLDIATGLCSDAGIDAATTVRVLTDHGAEPAALHAAMTRPVADSIADDQLPLFADVPDLATRPAPSAVEVLSRFDRGVLAKMDFGERDQVATAATIVARIGDVDVVGAVAILDHYGATGADIEYALRCAYYQPDTDRVAPNWPQADIDAAFSSGIAAPAPTESIAAVVSVVGLVRQVASSNEPARIVALADAFALSHVDAVTVWADAGIGPAVAADAAVLRRHGNLQQAAHDLALGWTEPLESDWSAYLPSPPPAAADPVEAILAGWANLSTPSLVNAAEIP